MAIDRHFAIICIYIFDIDYQLA